MIKTVRVNEYSDQYKDEVIDLILDIQQHEFNIPICKEDQPDICDIPGFYQQGTGNFWVANCSDEVIGSIALLDIGNQQTALRKMFVKSSYRGSEYLTARTLLSKALEWAKQKGITEIYLGTTDKFLAAHRFYEKNKFEKISKDELPENFPIMKVDTIFYKYVL